MQTQHQTGTKMGIIQKLNWGSRTNNFDKSKNSAFGCWSTQQHISPNQDQIRKDDKYPIKSKFNCTRLDNKDVAITRASSFLSVDNVRFLPLCVGSALLITPSSLANGCCIRNACNFKKSMQFQLWIGNLHILRSAGTDTSWGWIDNQIWEHELPSGGGFGNCLHAGEDRVVVGGNFVKIKFDNRIICTSSQYGEDHFPPLLRLEKQKIRDHFPDETSHRAFSSDQTLDKYTVTSWSLVRPTPLALSLWIFKTYIAEANIQYLLPNFNFS